MCSPDQPAQDAQIAQKELCPTSKWVSPPASPACAPCTVCIALWPAGKLQVHHTIALGHIQASGSNIADQQRPVNPTAKLGQLTLALPLTHLAMQAAHRHVVGTQLELGILQRAHHKSRVERNRQACVPLCADGALPCFESGMSPADHSLCCKFTAWQRRGPSPGGNASSLVAWAVNSVLLLHEQQLLPALLPQHACQAHHSWAYAANIKLLLIVHSSKHVLLAQSTLSRCW